MPGTDVHLTPLHPLHEARGGKMVTFAGYSLPVQYPDGIMAEHRHTRAKAGLFDVSHMGQIRVVPRSAQISDAAAALEALVPSDIVGLAKGRQRYSLLMNDVAGIRDDLMIANWGDHLGLVVNAACKMMDFAHLQASLGTSCDVTLQDDLALLALQGPLAEAVLAGLAPAVAAMRFMDVAEVELVGTPAWISRSGYTGEDGFEISVPAEAALEVAEALLAHPDVAPIGLGARDSLRLEAGLCLYGQDIDAETSPVAAGLTWAIQKVRRPGGARAGGYPGADVVAQELADGPAMRRVGLLPEGRAPMRAGVSLAEEADGPLIGRITSGGFSPSVEAPVAMGYVAAGAARDGHRLFGELRGRWHRARITRLPFHEPNYKR
ncbi:MAG: glycine cleavage system aminomethyltransferase GcvT [Pseudomonadota bacterium]